MCRATAVGRDLCADAREGVAHPQAREGRGSDAAVSVDQVRAPQPTGTRSRAWPPPPTRGTYATSTSPVSRAASTSCSIDPSRTQAQPSSPPRHHGADRPIEVGERDHRQGAGLDDACPVDDGIVNRERSARGHSRTEGHADGLEASCLATARQRHDGVSGIRPDDPGHVTFCNPLDVGGQQVSGVCAPCFVVMEPPSHRPRTSVGHGLGAGRITARSRRC